MEPVGDHLRWRLTVVPELTTPGNFLFGGCGLGAALVAIEAASQHPTVWSTAQYLSYAPTGSILDLTVTLAAVGRRVTQGRVVGYVGDTEILTVNAAVGAPGGLQAGGVWATAPEVRVFTQDWRDPVQVTDWVGSIADALGVQGYRPARPGLSGLGPAGAVGGEAAASPLGVEGAPEEILQDFGR